MSFRLLAAAAIAAILALPASAATKIDDPLKFVTTIYTTTVGKKPEPDDIYSARLDALFKLDSKEAGGEVGRIDFDFWMNAQDGAISGITVKSAAIYSASRLILNPIGSKAQRQLR